MSAGKVHVNEEQAMVRAAGQIGFYTLLSRITGLLRDIVIGSVFGELNADEAYAGLQSMGVLRDGRLPVVIDGSAYSATIEAYLFSPIVMGASNVFEPRAPAALNTGSMSGAAAPTLSVSDPTKLAASDYEMQFAGGTFTITRRSDGVVFTQAQVTPVPAIPGVIAEIDGLQIRNPLAGVANPGDRFLFKPFSTSANNISSMFSTPRALAVASPVAATMGTANTGSLQQIAISARSNPIAPAALGVVLTFTGSNTYTRSDQGATVFTYTPGQAIEATVGAPPLANWSLTLQGTPKVGDTVTVNTNLYPTQSAGNASAMMNLRDVAMFDGAALTDGYAGMISQIGIRTQSADYAALVSASIATNVERDRAGVSGVNLDEEAASLLQFQQAYQASAKMIQVAQNVFDTLIQNLGR